ncbi:MAG: tetratricopeptide repeat protein, partial [Chloroflexota bacterium]|nr:tetratricopeptide repeat protein [Chloroflexota bacterium]
MAKAQSRGRLPAALEPQQVLALATLLRHAQNGAFVAALYNTVAVRDAVVEALREQVAPLPVYDFTFTEKHPSPLDYRQKLPPDLLKERAVVFLYDLYRAGEQVYGYLELQREALAQFPHSLVLWLTPAERGEMVRRAPNFWSQHSGVFDFTIADRGALAQLRTAQLETGIRYIDRQTWERDHRLYRGLVEEYEKMASPPADTLVDLYNKLAQLYYTAGHYRQAHDWVQKGLQLAETSRQGKGSLYNTLGLVYRALGNYPDARAALVRALRIDEAAFGPDHP